MATFSRPGVVVNEGVLSDGLMPSKGSDHPAFPQMKFSWLATDRNDPRYRRVVLPKGHCLKPGPDDGVHYVVDGAGFPRAEIQIPKDKKTSPSILPMKRFDAATEKHRDGWRMCVLQWGRVYVRGSVFKLARDAFKAAEEWLDAQKPGWRSYVSGVNFVGKPPK